MAPAKCKPKTKHQDDTMLPCLLTLGTIAAPGLVIESIKLLLSSPAGTRTTTSAVLATPHTTAISITTPISSLGLVDDHTVDQDTAEDSTVAAHAG